jgi:hypothetical protein
MPFLDSGLKATSGKAVGTRPLPIRNPKFKIHNPK